MPIEHKQATPQAEVSASNLEWRWVIVVTALAMLVTSIPLFRALWGSRISPDRQFMGLIYNPLDGATYLSKIRLGVEGQWRTTFRHSPIEGEGAYLDLIYTGLGHITGYIGLSNILALHSFRLLMAFLMCLSLYQLASTIWQRQRNRRLFFLLSLFGSGFGWIMILFGVQESPDIIIPEAFPLYSALANAHFPLALALIALSAGTVIRVLRPDFDERPTVSNGGLLLFLSSLVLAIIAPHVLVPFTVGLGLVLLIAWVTERRIVWWQLRWMMMIVLPALPIALYYLAEVRYNPSVAAWSAQNVTLTPPPWIYFPGFGLPLLVAIPAIYRAIRQYEPDGDRFMLMWLVSIFVMVYMPLDPQRRFSMGVMIPIAYFAVRTLNGLWLQKNPNRARNRRAVFLVTVSSLTYAFLMITGFIASAAHTDARFYLNQHYIDAFEWIESQTSKSEVILADPHVSLWLPGWAGMRVVYAHPYETINSEQNEILVQAWYDATDSQDPICVELLQQYDVRYVLVGDIEASYNLGCVEQMEVVQQFGDLLIYAP